MVRTQIGEHTVVTMADAAAERLGRSALQALAADPGDEQALADLSEAVRARILPSWQDARDEGVVAWLRGQRFDGSEWLTTLAGAWVTARQEAR